MPFRVINRLFSRHLKLAEYVHSDIFAMYKREGQKMGFDYIESGPLVRSSYHAKKHLSK